MAWGDCPEHGDKPDYTCDDCVLPHNHIDYDPPDVEERNAQDPEPPEDPF